MSKYCNKCGKENKENYITCLNCGEPLSLIASINNQNNEIKSENQVNELTNDDYDEINKSISENESKALIEIFKLTLIALGILCILVIGISAYFGDNRNRQIGGNDKNVSENNQASSVKSDNNVAIDKSTADKVAASDLDAKIAALGDINTLTLDKAADIKTIRTTYEALTIDQKGFVTKLEVLVSAEKKITDVQVASQKAAAEKTAAKVNPDEIAKNFFNDIIIKVIPFEQNNHKYIAVMHKSNASSSQMYVRASILVQDATSYKELWKKELNLDVDVTGKLFDVKDLDSDGKNDVCYASLSEGSHTGSGKVGVYSIANKQEYSLIVTDGNTEPESGDINSDVGIKMYLYLRVIDMRAKLLKDYNKLQ